jgi:hypothetical protein
MRLDTFILRLRRGEREERPIGGEDMGFTDFFSGYGKVNSATQNRVTAAQRNDNNTSLKLIITIDMNGRMKNHTIIDEDISLKVGNLKLLKDSFKFIENINLKCILKNIHTHKLFLNNQEPYDFLFPSLRSGARIY